MMKFSLIGPIYPYRGGISHYTYYLDRALQHAGHETQVISFKRQYPRWLYPGTTDQDPSRIALKSNAVFTLDPFYPWTWFSSEQQIASWKPDLVIIQWWTPFWGVPFGVISNRLVKDDISTVYMIHNVLPHEQSPLDRWFAKSALSRGNAFITQTIPQKERLMKLIPGALVQVCEHPIYSQFSINQPTKLDARRSLGLPEQGTILLFFGIVRPYKGLNIVLEALHHLKNAALEPHLVIAGEFWENITAYQSRIAELGLIDQIHLVNRYIPNEEVDYYFSAADVLLAPYTGGTQSGVISLGFGYGIPMIISEKAAEGITTGELNNISIVPTADAQSLAAGIQSFIEKPLPVRRKSTTDFQDWERLIRVLESFVHQ